jgi:hypothetical protein
VTLEKAQADPSYALRGGGMLIARAAKQKHIDLTDTEVIVSPILPHEKLNLGALCR